MNDYPYTAMMTVLLTMTGVIVLGCIWRQRLGQAAADQIRQNLTRSVYELFLPALVLQMLWQSPLDINTLRIPAIAAVCILFSLLLARFCYAIPCRWRPDKPALGALLLASAFGNFTYLGLPVLTQAFGAEAGIIAIQFDLLAATPLLFTVGVLLATHYGHADGSLQHAMRQMLRVPALWAAALGLLLSGLAVPAPDGLLQLLTLLGTPVIPLMLLAVGMALRWQSGWLARLPLLLPVLLAQLIAMPLVAWLLCIWWHIPPSLVPQIIIEAAMPSMVLGLVVCDRFGLNTSLYAEAITVSTLLSLLTLPLWLMLV
ncbi:MAG: AEC family transporter [Mariprofundaceae bacterium]|nr:AEC family transporter [Mariprofundaceae bacterium]